MLLSRLNRYTSHATPSFSPNALSDDTSLSRPASCSLVSCTRNPILSLIARNRLVRYPLCEHLAKMAPITSSSSRRRARMRSRCTRTLRGTSRTRPRSSASAYDPLTRVGRMSTLNMFYNTKLIGQGRCHISSAPSPARPECHFLCFKLVIRSPARL